MNELWIPASACPHPGNALVGELNVPKLTVLCQQCGSAWNQGTVPGTVIDTLHDLLEQGRFTPRQPRPLPEP